MMAKLFPENPDLEVEAQTHHTWHIQNWVKLSRREHGPVFECGGYPWCVYPSLKKFWKVGRSGF